MFVYNNIVKIMYMYMYVKLLTIDIFAMDNIHVHM